MLLLIRYVFLIWISCKAQFQSKPCYSEAGIECDVYYNTTEEGCSDLELKFPHLYFRTDGLYPNKPSVFNLKPIEKSYSNTVYPGANVAFKVPPDASFQAVKGFELIRRSTYPINITACYIFAFNGSELNSSTKNGEFQFKIWPISVKSKTDFDFEVFSLPKPPKNELSGLSVTRSIAINKKYSLSEIPSADWVTTISYFSSSSEKYIYIEFAKPPDQYNFTNFIVKLIEVDVNGHEIRIVDDTVTSIYYHWFNHVQPGRYIITVEPQSTFEDCHCYNKNRICVTCIATATKPMIIENVTSTTTANPESTEHVLLTNKTSSGDGEKQKIIAAVLGTVIGLLLVILLGYFIFINRRKQNCIFKIANTLPDRQPDVERITTKTTHHVNDDKSCLKIPIVYIVNAEDHPHHVKAVEALARFLENNCQCHVIYAPWSLHEVLDDKFRWVINTIEKSDFIVIVNSKLSYQQFKSWKNKENREWKSTEPSHTFDLYLSSINQITKHIINVNNHFKCIVVHFSYTSSKYSLDELCMGAEYLIPEHMHELMCHIHQIDSRRAGYDNIGYFSDQISSTNDGRYLTHLINLAANFEMEHPHWFTKFFENGDQFDSGISSPSTSLSDEKFKHASLQCLSLDVNTNGQIYQNNLCSPPNINPQNNLGNGIPRQQSTEDNTTVPKQHPLRYSDPSSEVSNMMNPPDYFEEPSMISDEDVLSQQLRQEIYDLNNRMLAAQTENGIVFRRNIEEEEIQSLGGQSV